MKEPWKESVLLSPSFTRPPTQLAILTRDAVIKAFKEYDEKCREIEALFKNK